MARPRPGKNCKLSLPGRAVEVVRPSKQGSDDVGPTLEGRLVAESRLSTVSVSLAKLGGTIVPTPRDPQRSFGTAARECPHCRESRWVVAASEPMQDPLGNYVVLGVAGIFEGSSFVIALRQFLKQAGATPFWEALHRSKDPTTYTVLAEDAAALVGLVVAALGIALSHRFDKPELDGAASLVIGLLLAGVAVALIRESRGLLIGEGIRPETARAIRSIALEQPNVRDVGRVLSMYIGPDDVLVTMDLDFKDGTAEFPNEAVHATAWLSSASGVACFKL